jgi:hypothetical protein
MHLGGVLVLVARSAGGAERSSRGREGEKFLIYTGPEGEPGGESRFPLSLKTDGVLVFNTKLSLKKKKFSSSSSLSGCEGRFGGAYVLYSTSTPR